MQGLGRGIGVIGGGRLGLQLLHRACETGLPCRRLRTRSPLDGPVRPVVDIVDTWDHPSTEPWPPLVVIAVPDRAVNSVAASLASSVDLSGAVVLHTAGALTSDVLAPCRQPGAAVASWHPLQSFPELASGAAQWDGVPCAIEGDGRAVAEGEGLARALGMRPWPILADDKPRYHAAASVAGNLSHALVAAAADVMEGCGLPRGADGRSGLSPLVEASLAAALSVESWERLTGPAARGDEATVATHLEKLPRPLAEVYRSLLPLIRDRSASVCED